MLLPHLEGSQSPRDRDRDRVGLAPASVDRIREIRTRRSAASLLAAPPPRPRSCICGETGSRSFLLCRSLDFANCSSALWTFPIMKEKKDLKGHLAEDDNEWQISRRKGSRRHGPSGRRRSKRRRPQTRRAHRRLRSSRKRRPAIVGRARGSRKAPPRPALGAPPRGGGEPPTG